MTTRIPVGVFFALFTVSGFAGLIYESIWSHYLKLFLGHAAYAQTLVLAIFMGGMAIGSWLVSRYTNRIRNLLLGYAAAEFGIGVLAILFHQVFVAATGWAFESVLPSLGSPAMVDLFKWTLASALILPASILLGSTFPLMSAGIIRLYPQSSARVLSMLYFTNSLGASIGVLVSGFLLIRELGLPGTILTSGILNIVLAIAVWAITKRLPPVEGASAANDASATAGPRGIYVLILVLAFATGAASFIYEITWIRMLTLGLGASTHAFEVMLSAFILGMALGARVLRDRAAAMKSDIVWLAGILAAKGIFAIYAIGVYGKVLEMIVWLMHGIERSDPGYTLITVAGLVASMVVMFPTAFCAGMTLPLATNALISRGFGESSIGKVYGANTAGCIVGAAFTTHVGMELLGLKGLTGLGATLDVLMGVALVALVPAVSPGWRKPALAGLVVAAVVATVSFFSVELDPLKMSSGIFRYGIFLDPKTTSLDFYRDGKTATVSATRGGTAISIRTNGKPDAGVQMDDTKDPNTDESTMVLISALPLAFKPNAKDIAVIGFGSGMSTHTALAAPNVKTVDTIEIEPAMVEGARVFKHRNKRAYEDPRSHIIIEDAKTHFAAHSRQYDIILSEPSNPWVSGVSTLFSEEFYRQIRNYIRDDGLLVQWIQAYEINFELIATILKALGPSFGEYRLFATSEGDVLVVAAKSGPLPALTDELFSWPAMAADLARDGYASIEDLRITTIASRRSLEPLIASAVVPPNSDYFPVLDQNAARARFKRENALDLRSLRQAAVPMIPLIEPDLRYSAKSASMPVTVSNPRRELALTAVDAVRIFLTGSAEGTRHIGESGKMQYLFAHLGTDDCRVPRGVWLGVLSDLVTLASPILQKEDLAPIFDRIAKSKCAGALSDEDRQWVNMLRGICNRDAPMMGDAAEHLLAEGKVWVKSDRPTIVLAAMSAHLAVGNPTRAAAIWREHGEKLPPDVQRRLSTRLLLAHAGIRTVAGT